MDNKAIDEDDDGVTNGDGGGGGGDANELGEEGQKCV